MKPLRFKIRLFGAHGMETAALKPPFDVVEAFQRKGRVPVKGTINGFPFRSSLMNMGDGHMMVVNARAARRRQVQGRRHRRRGDGTRRRKAHASSARLPEEDHRRLTLRPENAWAKLAFTHQKEHVRAIEGAKRPETREKRIAAMMEMLRQKKRKK